MSNVLIEELGPKGKARVRLWTWIAVAAMVAIGAWILWTLGKQGQLEADRWTEMFAPATLEFLAGGLLNTFRAAVTAGALSIFFGFALAMARIARPAWARALATGYVEFFRALPLLLTIFMVYFGASALGFDLGIFWSLVVALVLYNSAVLSEIFRAGIRSLDKGQTEAAQAIGLPYWPMMRLIILPQAVRRMIPAIIAQMATLTKDVSLGFVISYAEFVARGSRLEAFSEYTTNFQAYVMVAVVYFTLIWAMARIARYFEERQKTQPALAVAEADDEAISVAEEAAAG